MKKRIYQAKKVNSLNLKALAEEFADLEIIVGIDVAKTVMFATLMSLKGEILLILRWDHLGESRQVVQWLSGLSVQVVLEPSGTYGDALRYLFYDAGVPVYRVNPKHTKDSREVFDGVPSSHDAKCSAIVAKLHLWERSSPWLASEQFQRTLSAKTQTLNLHTAALGPSLNHLEALLARFWPELPELLELDSATLLEVSAYYGSPAAVAEDPEEARRLMRGVGGPLLSEEKIEQVLVSAAKTLGVPMVAAECQLLRAVAQEARRRQRLVRCAQGELKSLSQEDERIAPLADQIGPVTAAVLVCLLGPLDGYSSTRSLVKASGLNLREISSGKRQGQLGITKRGPSQVRQYLYLAVLRWIQKDPWAKAWYDSKVHREGGKAKRKAIVALMRTLLGGLRHVALGESFDSTKLFDTKLLTPWVEASSTLARAA